MNRKGQAMKTALLSEKLIETRNGLRTMFSDYPERVRPYKVIVSRLAKDTGKPVLECAISLGKELEFDGHLPQWALVAAVDLIEEADRQTVSVGSLHLRRPE